MASSVSGKRNSAGVEEVLSAFNVTRVSARGWTGSWDADNRSAGGSARSEQWSPKATAMIHGGKEAVRWIMLRLMFMLGLPYSYTRFDRVRMGEISGWSASPGASRAWWAGEIARLRRVLAIRIGVAIPAGSWQTRGMMVPLVMTLIGKDRTGLVELVARIVADHGGNWLESRMCRLGGEFAGIARVEVREERREELERALSSVTGLAVVVRGDEELPVVDPCRMATVEVVGHDRPGIVREISRTLAAHGVNVEDLLTECTSAPMSGEALFKARARIRLPAALDPSELRVNLEQAADGLGLDLLFTTDD